MRYNLYEEMKKTRGEDTEFGNVELSYQYTLSNLKNCKNVKAKKVIDIGTNLGTLPYLLYHRNGL